jgi:ATP-dependent DNA ligase
MERAFYKLNKLDMTAGTNDKIVLLREYLEDPVFKKVIIYALDNRLHYKIKKLPEVSITRDDVTNDTVFSFLDYLAEKSGATKEDKETLASMCIDEFFKEVITRIIKKDLKCGVSNKLVNKAVPDTVFVVPYMRCSTEKKVKNIKYPAVVQKKADGMFSNMLDYFITRNGKKVYQLDHILNDNFIFTEDMVLLGELLVYENGKELSRKKGNGILNSCISNTCDPDDAIKVRYIVWDIIPRGDWERGVCNIKYVDRLYMLKECISKCDYVKLIDTVVVNSLARAKKVYRDYRGKGYEGAIIKNTDSIWKDHTSPNVVKLKNVSEGDLLIVGWMPGEKGTKYEDMLGSLLCQSSDGKIVVGVSSGLTDEQRKNLKPEDVIGKIVAVEYESVIESKNKDTYSLFLPRFVEIREDKDEADTFERLNDD